jgi:hypothetical protein
MNTLTPGNRAFPTRVLLPKPSTEQIKLEELATRQLSFHLSLTFTPNPSRELRTYGAKVESTLVPSTEEDPRYSRLRKADGSSGNYRGWVWPSFTP